MAHNTGPALFPGHRRELLALSLWRSCALATFLGSLPGIASLVLLGSSVSMDKEKVTMGFNPWTLLVSAGSFAASRYLRQRKGEKEEDGSHRGA